MSEVKLTQLSHGGGCGCKIAPAMLQQILGEVKEKLPYANLLVGAETSDDAAVYRLNDQQAIIATTDFFMPIVDDPFDFGRIAATNALSDVYAMGGTPIMALAIVGMPVNKLSVAAIRAILKGGEAICEVAGIPLAGGHSIDSTEPIYGLVAIGIVHPDRLKKNSGAQAGDRLILGKGLGVGVLAQAMKKGVLPAAGYAQLIATATQLNTVGSALAGLDGVHALTDVTGFGLLGHLLEMCRGAGMGAEVGLAQVPLLSEALPLAQQGYSPGAVERNLASYGHEVDFAANLQDWQRRLLADAQTSGGLLVSVAPEVADEVLAMFHRAGFGQAAVIGDMRRGAPRVSVL
ncbi:MAG: selenide, water dikinase SelD [Gallionellales bacterium RIFCSPLOWO2_12_FULL_59_22]|nr:MAG: selenide, water dikinase SelD [Gallionellales bacterium RIFCSPLOWO2_02_FULL_59_110]OGT05688.1 MAG: selenide, water dikinase SelD [Gallionellales bacterium RIFCSPLOWO2_02_58_13]OGT14650.1 MAG: selenide, water dikinase SelD [Gallionellales bacterium RIFCSPLOWO2_12_FULL_59_22]